MFQTQETALMAFVTVFYHVGGLLCDDDVVVHQQL